MFFVQYSGNHRCLGVKSYTVYKFILLSKFNFGGFNWRKNKFITVSRSSFNVPACSKSTKLYSAKSRRYILGINQSTANHPLVHTYFTVFHNSLLLIFTYFHSVNASQLCSLNGKNRNDVNGGRC